LPIAPPPEDRGFVACRHTFPGWITPARRGRKRTPARPDSQKARILAGTAHGGSGRI